MFITMHWCLSSMSLFLLFYGVSIALVLIYINHYTPPPPIARVFSVTHFIFSPLYFPTPFLTSSSLYVPISLYVFLLIVWIFLPSSFCTFPSLPLHLHPQPFDVFLSYFILPNISRAFISSLLNILFPWDFLVHLNLQFNLYVHRTPLSAPIFLTFSPKWLHLFPYYTISFPTCFTFLLLTFIFPSYP